MIDVGGRWIEWRAVRLTRCLFVTDLWRKRKKMNLAYRFTSGRHDHQPGPDGVTVGYDQLATLMWVRART